MLHVWETVQVHTGFWWGDLREIEGFEDLGVDGRIILKMFFKNGHGNVGWIALAQNRDIYRVNVNAKLKFRVP